MKGSKPPIRAHRVQPISGGFTKIDLPVIKNVEKSTEKQTCNICAQNVPGIERDKIFALGKCDHPVCYVCSARMRVICDQLDCPICRDKLDFVAFTESNKNSYAKLNLKSFILDNKFKIYFECQSIKQAFDKLLSYECLECSKNFNRKEPRCGANDENKPSGQPQDVKSPKTKHQKKGAKASGSDDSAKVHGESDSNCPESPKETKRVIFPDVLSLKNHLNYVHKLKLCDLCLTHDKLFPFEYSYYDINALKKHMKEGEPKTSHRGHPSCQLCHDIFFNMDELLLHMAREHFHCHICARQESNLRYYFLDYASLREHFKNKHFLCERGPCREEQFTSAFENNIEFQLHLVQIHGNPSANLSRGESRQQRTITLESASLRSNRSDSSPNRTIRNRNPNVAVISTGVLARANDPQRQRLPEAFLAQVRQQRLPSQNEFPELGGVSTSRSGASGTSSGLVRQANAQTNSTSLSHRISTPCSSSNSFVRTLGGGYRAAQDLNESDFPPLPGQPKSKPSKSNKSKKKKQNDNIGEVSLDQLIRSSLVLGSNTSRPNRKDERHNKNVKYKPLKIQLS